MSHFSYDEMDKCYSILVAVNHPLMIGKFYRGQLLYQHYQPLVLLNKGTDILLLELLLGKIYYTHQEYSN